MSHYTVLVVGDDIDEALAPFDENIEMPRYKTGEVSEDDKIRFVQYYLNKGKQEYEHLTEEEVIQKMQEDETLFETLYKEYGDDWNGREWKKDSKGVWCEFSTYNPNSKWDWYEVGGRWAGKLLLKEEVPQTSGHETPNFSWGWSEEEQARVLTDDRRVDSARVGEIDWEEMNRRVLESANKTYDEFEAAMQDPEKAKTISPYFQYGINAIEVTPEEFEAQKDNPMYYWNERVGKYFRYQTREEYTGKGKFSTFALLIDGEWYERGKMGWFGIVSNEKGGDTWEEEFEDKIRSLSPDTRITVVDCHI